MFWTFENGIFQLLANFWVTKLFWESDAKRWKLFNPMLVIRNILDNSFEITLRSKAKIVSFLKLRFSLFSNFLNYEVESIFWESGEKR